MKHHFKQIHTKLKISWSYQIPSKKLTYPTWGKGKSSSNAFFRGYVCSLEGIQTLNKSTENGEFWQTKISDLQKRSEPKKETKNLEGPFVVSFNGEWFFGKLKVAWVHEKMEYFHPIFTKPSWPNSCKIQRILTSDVRNDLS